MFIINFVTVRSIGDNIKKRGKAKTGDNNDDHNNNIIAIVLQNNNLRKENSNNGV